MEMEHGERLKHKSKGLSGSLKVSQFEKKCVEFINDKYIRKKNLNVSSKEFPEETQKIFHERLNT